MKNSKKLIFISAFLLLTLPVFSQEYGLVLSGGGGKGAYEVGVWKALIEYGIAQKTTEISGTSVGGLNSALFATTPYEQIEQIWTQQVPKLLTTTTGTVKETLISQRGLYKIIESVSVDKLQQNAYPNVTVTACYKTNTFQKLFTSKEPGSTARRFNLNAEPDQDEIRKELLATAAFPIVTEPILLQDGKLYTDGGEEKMGGDNTPVLPVTKNPNIKTIFIVYLSDLSRLSRRIRQIDYPTKKLIEIIPSIDLGSMLEGTVNFTSDRINLLIQTGYEDAVEVLTKKGFHPISSYWYY